MHITMHSIISMNVLKIRAAIAFHGDCVLALSVMVINRRNAVARCYVYTRVFLEETYHEGKRHEWIVKRKCADRSVISHRAEAELC